MRRGHYGFVGLSLFMLSACQSASPTLTPVAAQAAPPATAAPSAVAAYASPAATSPAQCAFTIAGGPPPKPAKGADFGQAVAKNMGKNVGKNLIAGMGSRIAGPLGGVVAGAVATDMIRSEQDMKGVWTATDGAPTCGCAIDVSAGINLQGKIADKGKLTARGCGNPLLSRAARWTLGYSFTGYDAPLDLIAPDGAKLATLKRDGVDYFSGALADGTPVTIWRQ